MDGSLGTPMTLLEKLRAISRLKPGMEFPGFLKNEGGNWGYLLAKLCGDAADEIYRVHQLEAGIRQWQPIGTAPVEPWDKAPSCYAFPCLLQLQQGHPSSPPHVCSGEAYYTFAPRSKEQRILRWRSGGRQVFPKYWMPLPLPAPKLED
jgi:hypothetical protein